MIQDKIRIVSSEDDFVAWCCLSVSCSLSVCVAVLILYFTLLLVIIIHLNIIVRPVEGSFLSYEMKIKPVLKILMMDEIFGVSV